MRPPSSAIETLDSARSISLMSQFCTSLDEVKGACLDGMAKVDRWPHVADLFRKLVVCDITGLGQPTLSDRQGWDGPSWVSSEGIALAMFQTTLLVCSQ